MVSSLLLASCVVSSSSTSSSSSSSSSGNGYCFRGPFDADTTTIMAAGGKYDYYDDSVDNAPYGTDNGYDDGGYGGPPPRRQQQPPPSNRYIPREQTFATLGGLLKNQRQLGAGLLGVGVLLTFMGMMLFFEGTLLRLGNMCIIFGVPFLVGPDRVRSFFLKESRMQASTITAVGIVLVFWGKPRLGILCEIFGLLNLFGNMFPLLFAVGRRLPVVGDLLSMFEGEGREGERTGPRRPPRREPDFNDGTPPKRYTPDF